MPVRVDTIRPSHNGHAGFPGEIPFPQSKLSQPPNECIRIGLINNMPDAAFKATEHQFASLLNAASEGIEVLLSLYTLPCIARTEPIVRVAARHYSSVETLWDAGLDALIVTGKEPVSADLRDEPCWQMMTRILEWAQENTHSTVWSCLAAHAAVLHMDGIRRRRSNDKDFGVFECARVADHPLLAGASPRFSIPHSRWNGVDAEELEARGYRVLVRTADAAPDTFVKESKSLFVFFQGHPEYESNTLLREYRRDAERYFKHEASAHPSIPRSYFDPLTESTLAVLRERAQSSSGDELSADLATALKTSVIENTWHKTAARIYRNWLEQIQLRKNATQRQKHAKMA
jgi:homoserine O-succinyltransferase/O-acetyltransferase